MVFYKCIKCGKRALKAKIQEDGEKTTALYTPKGLICHECKNEKTPIV